MSGNIFILSAASGTGKTTLVKRLLDHQADIRVSVSHTTRPPRQGEENGRHYHFTDRDTFERMIGEAAFLEHAEVYGNYYGTSLAQLEALRRQGFDVILEIDVQGAAQVRRLLPDAVSIFIAPPSLATLAYRLGNRGTDSPEVIGRRLAQARNEIEQAPLFDYLIINDDLDRAEAELTAVIKTRRLLSSQCEHIITRLLSESL